MEKDSQQNALAIIWLFRARARLFIIKPHSWHSLASW